MNRQEMLTQIGKEIEGNLPSLGVWQGRGLAVLVLGLLALGQAQLSKIAEGVPEEGSYNTVRQRVKRWTSNRRVGLEAVRYEWIRWVWRKYGGRRAVLLVDETKLGDRFGVMMVSLAYAGRAIPLWWRCYEANNAEAYPQQGQVLLIYGLLAHVLWALPPQACPLVQMDRGLAHSSAMLRALKSLGVEYLVRVKASARFTSRSGTSQLLKHWVRRGHALRLRGSLFDRDHACAGTLCLLWEATQDEAWCLFSNSPRAIGHYYALRWWQEESFRDLKTAGWHWRSSHLRCPMRMERLILAMTIAYALTIANGVQVWSQPSRVRNLTATPDELPRLSLFSLGLRYLRRAFADVAPLHPFLLYFPAPAFFRRI